MIVDNMPRIVHINTAKHGELGEAVLQRIEQMVLTGAIGAGERINELQLAAKLKVSRGPLREALGRLEATGLLVSIPNRGMFVRKVELADALHLYDVRAGLARTTGRLAAQRPSRPQNERLRAAVAEIEAAVKADDTAAFYAGNLDFHSLLIDYAGNPRLAAMNEAVRNEL